MQADDFIVTEMAAVHLFHATGNVTCIVTGERYCSLLKKSVILAFQSRRSDKTTMFMRDDAPPHIARCVNQLFAAISSTTETSAGNLLQLGLLDPTT